MNGNAESIKRADNDKSPGMLPSMSVHRLIVLTLTGFGLLVFGSACGNNAAQQRMARQRMAPHDKWSIGSGNTDMSFTFIRWRGGLMLLFVDGFKGGHSQSGSSDYATASSTESGLAESATGPQYSWLLKTSDGKTAAFRIDDNEYDLSKGAMFVSTIKDGKVELHQLNRDLSLVPFEIPECKEYLKNDPEVQKLLGLALPENEKK
jgi:hypothetical protein